MWGGSLKFKMYIRVCMEVGVTEKDMGHYLQGCNGLFMLYRA